MYSKEDLKYIADKVLEGVKERILNDLNIDDSLYGVFIDTSFVSNWVESNILKEKNIEYYTIEQLIDLYYKRINETDYCKELRDMKKDPELIDWYIKQLTLNSRELLFDKLIDKYGKLKAFKYIDLYIDNKKENIEDSMIYKDLKKYSIDNLFKESEEHLAEYYFHIISKIHKEEKEKEDKKYKKAHLAVATG
jgi:hypothetical protein